MMSSKSLSTIRLALRAVQCIAIAILLTLLAIPAVSQEPPATLTLEEAIALAKRHNPLYRMAANDAVSADWAVREAYGNLLPNIGLSGSSYYQAEGTERLGATFSSTSPATYGSSYGLGASMSFSGSTFFQMSQAKANRSATDARIAAGEYQLAADVTRAYLAAKRTGDEVALREQQLETARQALLLATGRFEAGEAPRLDVAQAEVTHGRASVDVLQARNNARAQRRALLQLMGVEINRDVQLTSVLTVFEPKWTLEELVDAALASHPQLLAAKASERASRASARSAAMSYLPSISLNAGFGGSTRATADEDGLVANAQAGVANSRESCEQEAALNARLSSPLPGYVPRDCSAIIFTEADRLEVLQSNKAFPFNFSNSPLNVGLSISLPIFNGFSREAQVQQARAAAQDAQYMARQEELNRRALVANAFEALQTAYQTVTLEERNAEVGAEQLRIAQGRYSLGAGNIVELTTAQQVKATADQARLSAIYAFHENYAALENAVGRKLVR